MILVGNQRGGAKDLALHLLKQENEHVEVHEVRGFASQNLKDSCTTVFMEFSCVCTTYKINYLKM